MSDTWAITVIVVLLGLSGYLSAAETALLAASRPKLHQLKKHGNRAASIVESLQDRIEQVIGAVLLYNNLSNILASSLATSVLISLVGEAGVFYASGVMTVLVLFFSDVVPKMLAVNRPEKTALAVAPILRILVEAAGPITLLLRNTAHIALKTLGFDIVSKSTGSAREELRGMIDYHAIQHDEAVPEKAMLTSILDLSSVKVGEIITHRKNISMIDVSWPPQEILDFVLKAPYTRFPVWRENPENIIGILNVKDLLRAVGAHPDSTHSINIPALCSPPWFIPETTTLLDQLTAFRDRHEHFALVVDEYGALQGTVTLEDILEEIVGDITDEHDHPITGVRPEPDGSFLMAGNVTIRDLNRQFGWNLPDHDASTIAGLVLYETARIPDPGQAFRIHGLKIEILGRNRNQITSLRVWDDRQAHSALAPHEGLS